MFYRQLCRLYYEKIICILCDGIEYDYIAGRTQKVLVVFLSSFVSIEVDRLKELSEKQE